MSFIVDGKRYPLVCMSITKPQGRTTEADRLSAPHWAPPGPLSGGKHSCGSRGPEGDFFSSDSRCRSLDTQHRRAVTHAATHPNYKTVFMKDLANTLRDEGALDESESFRRHVCRPKAAARRSARRNA